jgi:hypothetical protein
MALMKVKMNEHVMKLDVGCALMNILNKVNGITKCLGPFMLMLTMLIQ